MDKALVFKLLGGVVVAGGIATTVVLVSNGKMGDDEWKFYYRFLGYKYLSTVEHEGYSLTQLSDSNFPLALSTTEEYTKFNNKHLEFYKYKCGSYDSKNNSHKNLEIMCGEIGSEEAKKFYEIWSKNKKTNNDKFPDILDKNQEFKKCEWAEEKKEECLEIFKHKPKNPSNPE